MKKLTIIIAIAAIMTAMLTACGSGNTAPADSTTAAVKAEIKPADVTAEIVEKVGMESGVEKTDAAVCDFYGFDEATIESASLYICGSAAYPDEILAVKFKDGFDAEAVKSAITKRIDEQKATYESYTPAEFYKLEGHYTTVSGNYAFVAVTADNTKASEIIQSYLK